MFGLQAAGIIQKFRAAGQGAIGGILAGIIGDCEQSLEHNGPIKFNGPVDFSKSPTIGGDEIVPTDASAPPHQYIRYTLAADLVGGASVDVLVDTDTYTITNRFYTSDRKYEDTIVVGAIWDGTSTDGKWNMDLIAASDCPVRA